MTASLSVIKELDINRGTSISYLEAEGGNLQEQAKPGVRHIVKHGIEHLTVTVFFSGVY